MSYAMFCATHGPRMEAPCSECGAWHSDPGGDESTEEARAKLDAAVRDMGPPAAKIIDLMGELKRALETDRARRASGEET